MIEAPAPFNFSHTLMTQLDCDRKIQLYLQAKADGEQYSGAAATRGIRLHEYCEAFLKGEQVHCDNEDHFYTFEKIREYLDSIYTQVVDLETEYHKPLVDNILGKGRLDARLGDGTIVDWKFPGKEWDDQKYLWYVEKQGWFYLWLTGAFHFHFVVVPTKGELKVWKLMRDDVKIEREVRLWKSQARILKSKIISGDFVADPAVMKCRFCNFRSICPDRF